jgi:ubiquitin-protein ligase
MSSIKVKRILYDYKLINQNDLESIGIYIKTNDDDIENAKALIIGPDDSVYEKGFYFFDITFPKNYPNSPPTVLFYTQSKKKDVRFNPNLYTNGKVCLSILGTWMGPSWTSCMNLSQVLLSIQSLLNDNPLQNEPGFENEVGEKAINYLNLIKYYNISIASLDMITNIPKGFEEFQDIINAKFKENLQFYNKFIEDNIENDNKLFKSSIYSMSEVYDINSLKTKIETIKTMLNIESEDKDILINSNENNTINKKKIKK